MMLLPERSVTTLDTVHCCDALSLLRGLPAGYVDAIVTDPPYMGVKDEAWDNQWSTPTAYLDWLGLHLEQFKRVLKSNGSLYLFASPQMAARVEVKVGEWFNVLNRITWKKPKFATKAEMCDKETMRAFFPASEAIIFAEQFGGDRPFQDALIDGNSTYWGACEAVKRSIFGEYLTAEFDRAHATRRDIAALFPSASGGLTGCVSNWILGYNCPTAEQYQKIREYLNGLNGHADYLRREYEDLRRPFNLTAYDQYTDVWTFRTVQAYDGKHPCEKPLDLLKHIIQTSTRPDAIVLDCFVGSGATLDAARQLGRRYIGCEKDAHWASYARNRINQLFTLPLFEVNT